MTASVELISTTKRFGTLTAVDDVSLRIEEGEMVTFLGPSGCGKTTLLNLVGGFYEPDAGRILIGGRDIVDLPPHERDLGIVFQSYALFPHMSVAGNVAFGLRMRGVPRSEIAERVTSALDMVRLPGMADRNPGQLSGGQRQRVALARALVFNPSVLLLDEPLSALDKNLRAAMQLELKELQRRVGITTICVTHDQGEALSMSDRVAVFSGGVMQQLAKPHDIYFHPATPFVASFVGETNCWEGVVSALDARHVTVTTGIHALGPIARPAELSLQQGSKVAVYLRPEFISLGAAGTEGALEGKIAGISFQGAFADVVVDCDGLPPVMLRTTDVQGDLGNGQPVTLRPNLNKAVLFPL